MDSGILAFTVAVALLVITPGIDTMLVIRNTSRRGRMAGILTTCGIGLGVFVHAGLSAVGLSIILMQSALAFEVVKILGAIYLTWLGAKSLFSAYGKHEGPDDITKAAIRNSKNSFFEGLLTNVLNPKMAIFYISFLPQFVDQQQSIMLRSMILAAIHYTLGMIWLLLIVVAFDTFHSVLHRPSMRRWMEGVTGVVLIGLGLRLALEKH